MPIPLSDFLEFDILGDTDLQRSINAFRTDPDDPAVRVPRTFASMRLECAFSDNVDVKFSVRTVVVDDGNPDLAAILEGRRHEFVGHTDDAYRSLVYRFTEDVPVGEFLARTYGAGGAGDVTLLGFVTSRDDEYKCRLSA